MAKTPENPPRSDHEFALPDHVAGSGTLDRLVDTARDYARAAVADSTRRAYATDWSNYTRWCRMKGAEPLPPSPEMRVLDDATRLIPAVDEFVQELSGARESAG